MKWRALPLLATLLLEAAAFQAPRFHSAARARASRAAARRGVSCPPSSTALFAVEEVDALSLTGQKKLPDLSQTAFPDVPDEPYDLIVLGSGPAGETAAVRASQLGAKVAVIEVKKSFGGPTGLTSKAVREAAKRIVKTVDQVGGDRNRQIRRLWKKRFPALKSEAEVYQAAETRERLNKNAVDLYVGAALLVKDPWEEDPEHVTVRVCRPTGCVELQATYVVIATGSRPNRPKELKPGLPIPFTSRRVVDATQMANLKELPESLAVIGGGVIGVEYATILAQLGVSTSILCKEKAFLPFLPQELRDAIKRQMLEEGVEFIHSDITSFEVGDDKLARMELDDRRLLEVDIVLYSGGRDANSEKIGCENVGVQVGKYGRIQVDDNFRTDHPRIFAIGDVIGPPGLASFAQQSARVVTDLLFRHYDDDEDEDGVGLGKGPSVTLEDWVDDDFFTPVQSSYEDEEKELQHELALLNRQQAPLTLWTIPEVASVGLSVEQAQQQGMEMATADSGQIVAGYAYFKDLARGRLSGDPNGFLKIIAKVEGPNRHVIIGFHIVGEGANELIQLGSILVHAGTTLEELSNTPFAAVTLSCLYQMASDDALCNSPRNAQKKPSQRGLVIGSLDKRLKRNLLGGGGGGGRGSMVL